MILFIQMQQVIKSLASINGRNQSNSWPLIKNYTGKNLQRQKPRWVNWTQTIPQTSLDLIEHANLPKNAAIIDVGGGESHLIDHLLMLGYSDLSVLDISKNAIERSKQRLGGKAGNGLKPIFVCLNQHAPIRFGMTVRYFIFLQMRMT